MCRRSRARPMDRSRSGAGRPGTLCKVDPISGGPRRSVLRGNGRRNGTVARRRCHLRGPRIENGRCCRVGDVQNSTLRSVCRPDRVFVAGSLQRVFGGRRIRTRGGIWHGWETCEGCTALVRIRNRRTACLCPVNRGPQKALGYRSGKPLHDADRQVPGPCKVCESCSACRLWQAGRVRDPGIVFALCVPPNPGQV